jgi:tRNA dimethylallyltransferase
MSEPAENPDGAGLPVLVVFGPTASGKTALAEALFASGDLPVLPGTDARLRGKAEIVSADSMQVYRGMDIGTAKPDASLLESLPHHVIDIRDPDEQFCAGDFVRLADEACREIAARGKLPVVLGGTGFYVKNFLFGLPETPESDPALRAELLERMRVEGPRRLMEELRSCDPESAARIHPNDEYRIARALEVYRASSRPLSSFALSSSFRGGFRFLALAIERDREELNGRINARVDAMFDSGLEGEFESLVKAGYGPSDPGMQAIGYREFFGAPDAIAAREAIKNDSRKYAKRQETFIRPIPGILRLSADDIAGFFGAVAGFWDPARGEPTP